MKIRNILLSCLLAASCVLAAGCSKPDDFSAVGVTTTDDGTSASAVGNVADVQLQAGDIVAEFEIEGYGTIKAKLFPEQAPTGVENFVALANEGFYDGLTIHRVIKGFMLQGGSLNGDGTGGEAAEGGTFGIETNADMRHFYGALCYANAMGNNSCQFYIVNNNEPQDLAEMDLELIKSNAEIAAQYATMFEAGTIEQQYYAYMAEYYGNLAEMTETAPADVIAKYKTDGGTPQLDGGYTVFGQVYDGFDVIDEISSCSVKTNAGGEASEPIETITIKSVKIITI